MKKLFLTVCIIAMTTFIMAQQFNYTPNEGGSSTFSGDLQNAPMAACDNEKGYYDFPFTEDGITITGTGTGSFTVYANGWGSCGIFAGANCIWIGSSGPATFTNTFSSPVNDMIYNITAMDSDVGGEIITITTDAGVPSIIYTDGTCSSDVSIIGNVITCINETGWDGTGGRFLVHSTSNFTSITFSINGVNNGTTMTMCFDQVFNPPPPTDIPVSNWALIGGAVLMVVFVALRMRRTI